MLKELTERCSWGTSADGYSVGSLSAPSPSQAMWPDRPSPGALTYWCHTCCMESDEQFCSTCGATLKSTDPDGSPLPGSAVRVGRRQV